MAISTLTPTISACIKGQCATLYIQDTTYAYSTENVGGWGATNVETVNIDLATIAYTTPGSSTQVVIDVTAIVNSQTTVSGEFSLAELSITPLDGVYSFEYTLTVGAESVMYSTSIFSSCVVECCVNKLWTKVAQEAISSDDCGCTEGSKESYSKKAMVAQSLLFALRNGVSCNDMTGKENTLKKLQRLCKLENCNCK